MAECRPVQAAEVANAGDRGKVIVAERAATTVHRLLRQWQRGGIVAHVLMRHCEVVYRGQGLLVGDRCPERGSTSISSGSAAAWSFIYLPVHRPMLGGPSLPDQRHNMLIPERAPRGG